MKQTKDENKTEIYNKKTVYIPVKYKFIIAFTMSIIWMILSIYLSFSWLEDLANDTNWVIAIFIIGGIAYVPGWLNAFLVVSLLLDKQPELKINNPDKPVTLLIAAYNEEEGIYNTLNYVKEQDYIGNINIIVINNNSKDNTKKEIKRAKEELNLAVECIDELKPGKFNALNKGLKYVKTKYVITLDADTLLHKSAVKYLISRIESSKDDIKAVAGTVLVRNSRDNLLARVQEWDYFLSIASIKRMQGLYQGTLVAQGAFSVYKTQALNEVGGWSNAIGEDIVLTWDFLSRGYGVYFEPLAIAFTDVPTKLKHFIKQRSRWARGMIEGLRKVKPWEQKSNYYKFLTGIDLVLPYMDFSFTFFWIPGLVLACFGKFYIVGPMTVLVLPLTMLTFYILYSYQEKNVFRPLNLKVRRNKRGFIIFILFYQILISPISLYGYIQELFNMKRVWK